MEIMKTLKIPVQIDGAEHEYNVDVLYQRAETGEIQVLGTYCEYLQYPSSEQTYQIHNQALKILGEMHAVHE